MKKNGFTLIEFLGCLALLGIVLLMGIYASRGVMATSLTNFRAVSDNEVFDAAKAYVKDENVTFTRSGYTCVTVKQLIEQGYLNNISDREISNKSIKLKRNNATNVIMSVKYVKKCN